MIGLTAAVYCCFQLSLCLTCLLYDGRHLSLSVRRKITVNVYLFNVYKRFFIFVTFLRFLTLFIFGGTFLANVHLRSRSLFAVASPTVCLSSVTLVRPTQAVQIFGNISTAFGTLAIRWHPRKILRRSSQENTSAVGVKQKRGAVKYSDFWPIEGYISETVQDRR